MRPMIPATCMVSLLRQVSTLCVTTLPRRRHSAVRSLPKRATSRPQTILPSGSMARTEASSTCASEITVSSSCLGNSPSTRTR